MVTRIIAAGHWHDGDPGILVIFDSGYDLTRLAWLLADLPVGGAGPAAQRPGDVLPRPGTPARHRTAARPGTAPRSSSPTSETWPAPAVTTVTGTTRYGTARAMAWSRLHQRLASRAGWEDHDGELPVIEGTLIRLAVDHLPGDRSPDPLWLWTTAPGLSADAVDRTWQAFLRRFDIEHTFRFFKQVLGWTRPKLRDPAAADRWTWLIIAAYAQLWLARGLAADIRLPWQRPCPPGRLTPARVRRGFRNIRQALPGSGQRAETRQTRPWPPARIEEPAPSHPPRRGQDRQARRAQEEKPAGRRVK